MQKKNIEIEFRSRFGVKKYKALKRFLSVNAKDLGEDDKDVYFFLFPDKLLKTVNNVSKKTAKIVLKLTKIGKGSDFEEIEVPINQSDFEKTSKMFMALHQGDFMHSFQKRQNFLYKGVELALKWSKLWGYHLELEVVIHDKNKKQFAERKIFSIAEELGVNIMSEKELREFTRRKEREYKNNKYLSIG